MVDHFEKIIEIQNQAGHEIYEKLGINLEQHWEEYEIQLSENGRIVEDINPNMRLNLGDMQVIVGEFGTEEEKQTLKSITKQIEQYYDGDLTEEEFSDVSIAKVTTDRQQNMEIECVSYFLKDNNEEIDFRNSVSQTINTINHSITTAHKEVMMGDVEYKGLYPLNEDEVVYCEITGKPFEQGEEVFYQEGFGYCSTVEFESCNKKLTPEDVQSENAYYTTVEYEDVEEKTMSTIEYTADEGYEEAGVRFIPTVATINEETLYRMQAVKPIGSIRKGELGGLVRESELSSDTTKEFVDQNKWLSKETFLEKGNTKEFNLNHNKDKENARKLYMMRHLHGRDY